MFGVRTLARPAIAALFISSGINALRSPAPHTRMAEPQVDDIASRLQDAGVDTNAQTLVKINGAVQIAGGALLVLNLAPRIAALALAGSLVPTTWSVHRFWEQQGEERENHQVHFFKNVAILGGLVYAALDTGGRPSVFWSGRRAAERAAAAVSSKAHDIVEAIPPHN